VSALDNTAADASAVYLCTIIVLT